MRYGWKLRLTLACVAVMTLTACVRGDDASDEPTPPVSTHKQTKIISIPMGDQKVQIHTFCVDAKGRLLCSCGGEQVVMRDTDEGFKSEIIRNEPGIRVVSPEGELLDVWEVDFTPQTVNVGPDGFVYCGGAGKVAKLTAEGKLVKIIDSPNTKEMRPLPEVPEEIKMTEAEREQRAQRKEYLTKQIADLRERMNQIHTELSKGNYSEIRAKFGELLQKSREKDLTKEEAAKIADELKEVRVALSKASLEIRKKMDESQDYQDVYEQYREASMQLRELRMNPMEAAIYQRNAAMRSRRISGIAVNDKDVFVCCQPPNGYGFQVWRGDHDLENFTMIVPSLRGCCGNMDIQAHGDKLYAAENARKKVVAFDRDGNKLAMWGGGKAGGTGLNFGSCCNPMNIRFDQDGNVLTSESNVGIVKRFTPEGEFLGRVGRVEIIPSCKHVAVGVADEGKKIYMLDITRSHIVLMEPAPAEEPETATPDSKTTSLFNGKDLTGWHVDVPHLDENPDAEPTFIVRDGKLVSLGQPRGHLITDAKYENYRLEVEYRFAGKPGNCGVLVHASTPRSLYKMFPKSIEVQMNHKHAGDFWCIVEDISVPNMVERRGLKEKWGITEGKARRILNLTDDSEKPLGQWNSMVIECVGDAVKVWVNGDLVNHGTKCTVTKGQIALQAEGAEVEFRKLLLTPIGELSE